MPGHPSMKVYETPGHAQCLFEWFYQQQLELTLSEILKQFDYLVDQGMVEKQDGVHDYKKR